jgi:hypothetical protein
MRSYLTEKIEGLQADLLQALDRNDYLEALKLRAVQRELELLLNALSEDDNALTIAMPDPAAYCSSAEAAERLGIDVSNVTRQAKALQGAKYKGKWFFPIDVVEAEAKKTAARKRPGRKAQRKTGQAEPGDE